MDSKSCARFEKEETMSRKRRREPEDDVLREMRRHQRGVAEFVTIFKATPLAIAAAAELDRQLGITERAEDEDDSSDYGC